jgi:hypothetical protein
MKRDDSSKQLSYYERLGFVARSGGATRQSNPYAPSTAQSNRVLPLEEAARCAAWYRGWDAADRQLR